MKGQCLQNTKGKRGRNENNSVNMISNLELRAGSTRQEGRQNADGFNPVLKPWLFLRKSLEDEVPRNEGTK